MNYMLVQVNSNKNPNVCYELECQINQLMKSGWEPIGGIAIHSFSDDMGQSQQIVYQPVVRRTAPVAQRADWGIAPDGTLQCHSVERYRFEPCVQKH